MDLMEQIAKDMKGAKLSIPLKLDMRNSTDWVAPRVPMVRKVVKLEVEETTERIIPPALMWFWSRLGITENILDAYHVGFATEVWLYISNNGSMTDMRWGRSTVEDPIFFYHFPESGHVKCYRPLTKDKKAKWISTANNDTDIQGLAQCDIEIRKPRLLVLVKSMKEVLFCRQFGIDAIAFHGENHIPTPEQIAYFRKYCGFLISLYDNDFAGIRGGIFLRNTYNIPNYFIPLCYGAKDPTDLYVKDAKRCLLLIDILNEVLKRDHPNEYTGVGPSSVGRF